MDIMSLEYDIGALISGWVKYPSHKDSRQSATIQSCVTDITPIIATNKVTPQYILAVVCVGVAQLRGASPDEIEDIYEQHKSCRLLDHQTFSQAVGLYNVTKASWLAVSPCARSSPYIDICNGHYDVGEKCYMKTFLDHLRGLDDAVMTSYS